MADTPYTPDRRATLTAAGALRDTADYARGLVLNLGVPMTTGERLRAARLLSVLAFKAIDALVLAELLEGADWSDVAAGLGMPEDHVRAVYQPTIDMWLADLPAGFDATIFGDNGTALRADADPEGTAAALDQWVARHCDPWPDGAEPGPVTRALTR